MGAAEATNFVGVGQKMPHLETVVEKKKKFCVYDKKYADCKREEKEPVKLLQVFFFFCCLFCFDLAWRPIDFLLFSVVIIILKP